MGNENIEKKDPENLKIVFILIFGLLATIISPWLFTISAKWKRFDFTYFGAIGDTIGGITAPIVGLLGAYLIYESFRVQREANKIQWIALKDEKERILTDRKLDLIIKYFENEIKDKRNSVSNKPISTSLDGIISYLKSTNINELNSDVVNQYKSNATRFTAYISLFNFCIEQLIELKIETTLKMFVINSMKEEYDTNLKNLKKLNFDLLEIEGLPTTNINAEIFLMKKLETYFPELFNDLFRLKRNFENL